MIKMYKVTLVLDLIIMFYESHDLNNNKLINEFIEHMKEDLKPTSSTQSKCLNFQI